MLVVEHLLDTEEVGEGIVECSLYVRRVGVSETIGQISRECPSVLHQSGVVRVHTAQGVVSVGNADGGTLAGSEVARTEVVVVRAAHGRHGEVVNLKR